MAEPSVGVVLLNWNLPQDTAECLASLQKSSNCNLHLIVVDNASSDDSVAYLRKHFPQVELICNNVNSGYAAGNNLGLRRCLELGLDYAMLLNNDTVIAEDTVSILVREAETDSAIGIVGPALYDFAQPYKLHSIGANFDRRWPMPRTLTTCPNGDQPLDVDIVVGTAMLIRSQVLRKVGLLDERYFMYYEDVDYCDRVRQHGWRIRVAPQAKVWHKQSRSTRHDVSLQRFYRAKYRMFYYYHYRHGPGRALTLGAMLLGDARQMIGDLSYRRTGSVRARLRGLVEGWRLAVTRERP